MRSKAIYESELRRKFAPLPQKNHPGGILKHVFPVR